MPRTRTRQTMARQQAGWVVSERLAGHLDRSEVLLVRFVALHQSLVGTSGWRDRGDDLAAAATAAELEPVSDGYAFADGTAPPDAEFDHPTIADDVHRRALVCATSALWSLRSRDGSAPATTPFGALDGRYAELLGPFGWAWWTCHLRDGDTVATITTRALAAFDAHQRLDRRRRWGVDDIVGAQHRWALSRRTPTVDPRHVPAAAAELGIKVTGS